MKKQLKRLKKKIRRLKEEIDTLNMENLGLYMDLSDQVEISDGLREDRYMMKQELEDKSVTDMLFDKATENLEAENLEFAQQNEQLMERNAELVKQNAELCKKIEDRGRHISELDDILKKTINNRDYFKKMYEHVLAYMDTCLNT